MIRRAATVVLIFAGLVPVAAAKEKLPDFTNYVVDAADVVPDDVERQVNAELESYQQRSRNQVAVAIVETTGNQLLEDYTIDLAKKWGIGQGEKDNGVLLLIAYDDRRLRIEVGEGIEGDLTDLESGRIIRDKITPLLRQGEVGQAVLVGTREIRRALGDAAAPVAPAQPDPDGDTGRPGNWLWGLAPFLFFPFIASRRRRRMTPTYWGGGGVHRSTRSDRRRLGDRREEDDDRGGGWLNALLLGGLLLGGRGGSGWGGDSDGGFGGGFGGGGGGDFGGGGASGDW